MEINLLTELIIRLTDISPSVSNSRLQVLYFITRSDALSNKQKIFSRHSYVYCTDSQDYTYVMRQSSVNYINVNDLVNLYSSAWHAACTADWRIASSIRRIFMYSRNNQNSSVNFKSYLVIGNLTMIKTDCYNVSHTQRPIHDRFEFCKKRKYVLIAP